MVDLMQQTRELLPCPFCGGEAERIDFGPGDAENEGGSCIACKRCQASGPVEFGFKENFIANWNRRAALHSAPEVTDEMVEAAHAAYWAHPDDSGEDRPCIRAALEAALAAHRQESHHD